MKTQKRFASIGSTIRDDPAMLISGVVASAATSVIAIEFGDSVDPITTSTRSSDVSLRMFRTAVVESDASSRTRYSTCLPPISFGISATVFFSGMPSAAPGPVTDSTTPTLTCAWPGGDSTSAETATSSDAMVFMRRLR